MSDDRNVFDPAERRALAVQRFEEALAARLPGWVDALLEDSAVRARMVASLVAAIERGTPLWGQDVHQSFRYALVRRAKDLGEQLAQELPLEVRLASGADDE